MKGIQQKNIACSLLFVVLMSGTALAADTDIDKLLNLSVKDLNKVKVTSVSRQEEDPFQSAAAVYVITNEDIKRSGVTSIPEALRMAPGVEVAQIGAGKWAVTIRGFNNQFSNKLLVLVDGRTVYNPLFSGVYWDEQDYVLEDIDRIEVIRGPGATLWGSNAVNGVINIITKSAKNTVGNYAEAYLGSKYNGGVSARHGGKTSEGVYYRTYAKYDKQNNSYPKDSNGAMDDMVNNRTGFRADWSKGIADNFSIHGDAYKGHERQLYQLQLVGGLSHTNNNGVENYNGGNVVGKWDHKISDRSNLSIQSYIDYVERSVAVLDQKRTTFDFDFQHSVMLNDKNDFIWGGNFRYFKDNLTSVAVNGYNYISYLPPDSDEVKYSAFIQDKYSLIPNKLFLTLGTKIEHDYYSGFQLEPNARLSYLLDDKQTIWASVARASRTPTRGEHSIVEEQVPSSMTFYGSRDYDAEHMIAYEFGYKLQPNWRTSYDIATFYNSYSDLQSFETISGTTSYIVGNKQKAESYGFEASSRYSVTKDWNLYANYSLYFLNISLTDGSTDLDKNYYTRLSPRNKAGFTSRMNLPEHIQFDNSIYYNDNLRGWNGYSPTPVQSYIKFDSRIGWKPYNNLELSLVGQNLLHDRRQEFVSPLFSVNSDIGRVIYGKVAYNF